MTTATDPATGELINLQELAEHYIHLTNMHGEAIQEATRIMGMLDDTRRTLTRVAPINTSIPAADGYHVVIEPGATGKRTIDTGTAASYQEELLDLGLGRRVTEYRPPTLADVNRHRAQIIARGIPIDRLVREPGDPKPKITIVKDGQ